jgi:hypothetical protein
MTLKQIAFVLIIVLLVVYFLIFIGNNVYTQYNKKKCNHNQKKVQKNEQSKCETDSCLDNYSDCECHKNQVKNELFTMAQSVFPLHMPTLPHFSQILNENMSNINASYTEQNKADPYTRRYSSKDTTTGFFTEIKQ